MKISKAKGFEKRPNLHNLALKRPIWQSWYGARVVRRIFIRSERGTRNNPNFGHERSQNRVCGLMVGQECRWFKSKDLVLRYAGSTGDAFILIYGNVRCHRAHLVQAFEPEYRAYGVASMTT
ncbi:hypothetical protein AVEN_266008-1 [Araneus ventricosus]|uniref:Uncharacterized protein n=1 Tax=Araneus ventricosus TaxID=182803 RepID=A0A4Y2RLH1_ARAVE|nr:hypothetical protein AVEN_266008-1 [Araneus ventricosus]